MRQTWLSRGVGPAVRYCFVVSAPDAETRARMPAVSDWLAEEHAAHRDVFLLGEVEDVYWGWQHTAKTILAFEAVYGLIDAQYYFNLHDDVYVALDRLLALSESWPRSRAYLGNASPTK